jgi:hypothetical protein
LRMERFLWLHRFRWLWRRSPIPISVLTCTQGGH